MGFSARFRHIGSLRPTPADALREPLCEPIRPSFKPFGAAGRTAFSILAAISFCHLLNDMMQSLLPRCIRC